VGKKKRQGSGAAPARGRPPKGGRPKGGAGAQKKKISKKPSGLSTKITRRSFTPEEKRIAVEAYLKSGLSMLEFGRLWDLSSSTMGKWVRLYEKDGPKGLERKPHAGKGKMRIAASLRDEIVRAKDFFPSFGLKRLRHHLMRFRGVKVSTGSIGKVLEEADVPPLPLPKKKRKRRKKVQRFERSKPGSLWQSDITSFVFTRNGGRSFLVVFLDDFSRYVVSFALALHQKQDLVMEALLSGIDRFGKPKEILSDQGRQYYSWRGKSFFQKYLDKQGIAHVVARSHHPQTLGKCERLWKTIHEEYWSRAQPQDLSEARDGLEHFFSHYNHHRPHQGIDGLVPADRFFGAESEVREAIEARLSENELRLALGEKPRRSVYLVGQIGDQAVSLHGERGKLVIEGPNGEEATFEPRDLGMPQEVCDVRGEEEEAPAAAQEESELPDAEDSSGLCAGALGVGERGGTGCGAPDGSGDSGDVAGPGEPPGGGREAERPGASDLAAVAAGAVGDGGRALEAAAGQDAENRADKGGQPLETAEEDGQNGEGAFEPSATGGASEGHAGASAEHEAQKTEPCPGEEPCAGPPKSQDGSVGICGSKKPAWTTEESWRAQWE
jgi:transposase InsO family protein/transposase-like protein